MGTDTGLCGALTGSGRPCRRRGVEGGRCGQHPVSGREGLPAPPGGLSSAALALWWSILAGEGADHDGYELEAHELALLREAVRAQSRCDVLDAVIAAEGPTSTGSKGQAVVHPALIEARQTQLTLARLVAALRMPQGEDDGRRSTATNDGRPQQRGGARGLYAVGGGA
jgi:hypothetical protein